MRGWQYIRVYAGELQQFKQYIETIDLEHGYTNLNTVFKTIARKGTPYVCFYWQSGRMKWCKPYSNGKGTRSAYDFSNLYHPDLTDFLTLI